MSDMTPYEILDAMLEGDWKWTQEQFVDTNGATCTLGRMGQVAYGLADLLPEQYHGAYGHLPENVNGVITALANAVREQYPDTTWAGDKPGWSWERVAGCNDTPGRTHAEVKAIVEKARANS